MTNTDDDAPRYRPHPYTVSDYRDAVNGIGPLAAEWTDKPHRLVLDLCDAIVAEVRETFTGDEWESVALIAATAAPDSTGYFCGGVDQLFRLAGMNVSATALIGRRL